MARRQAPGPGRGQQPAGAQARGRERGPARDRAQKLSVLAAIEELGADDAEAIELVAGRMRKTLVEVLGKTRGDAMYSRDWLEDRVRFHLDPARSVGAVFVARAPSREVLGHTIVRVEQEPPAPPFGLFSTTYVAPEARRSGVARQLLDRGERWMREHELSEAATHTAHDNAGLIALYTGRGYAIVRRADEMIRLARSL